MATDWGLKSYVDHTRKISITHTAVKVAAYTDTDAWPEGKDFSASSMTGKSSVVQKYFSTKLQTEVQNMQIAHSLNKKKDFCIHTKTVKLFLTNSVIK